MVDGVVKWFDVKKGYGFIVSSEAEGDVFAHYSKIQMEGFKKLEAGENVEFTLVTNEKGQPQAEAIVRKDGNASETQEG